MNPKMKNSPNEDETNLNKPKKEFEVNVMGNRTDINFFIPDVKGDPTGVAFRMAFCSARYDSKSNKELCTYIGSMLSAVVPEFRNSVVAALNEICVRPCLISLPSQANENQIVLIPQLGWPSIVVVFGYCILLLFNGGSPNQEAGSYNNSMRSRIREMQNVVRWDPSNTLDIPFDATLARSVSAMLGSHELRVTVKKFLNNNSNHSDYNIRNIGKYLRIKISQS